MFEIQSTRHTGWLIIWHARARTTRGTYAQCADAIAQDQIWNMVLGWWSVGSLLWNPLAMRKNTKARKDLTRQAQDAGQYGRWWATHYGATDPSYRPWVPPPVKPAKKWWLWIPLGLIAFLIVLIVIIMIASAILRATGVVKRDRYDYDSYQSSPSYSVFNDMAHTAVTSPTVIRLG